jgi:hypothetical protein
MNRGLCGRVENWRLVRPSEVAMVGRSPVIKALRQENPWRGKAAQSKELAGQARHDKRYRS